MQPLLIATLLAIAVMPVGAAPAFVQKETLTTPAGLKYSAWLPADFAVHHHDVPLILFSHGFGGCAQQSSQLTQALADHGYAVLAPDHHDHACERYTTGMLGAALSYITGKGPDVSFGAPQRWTDTTEKSRRDDIEALLDFALHQEPYKAAIDPSRIALMGHSLGGYTVLGMAGGWDAWRDTRFKAVLAMAPYSAPFLTQQRMAHIHLPLMLMAGTGDNLVDAKEVEQSYAAGSTGSAGKSRKYLVVLNGAGHFAYTQLSQDYQNTIADYAIGFFDRELLHRPSGLLENPASGQVSQYQHSP